MFCLIRATVGLTSQWQEVVAGCLSSVCFVIPPREPLFFPQTRFIFWSRSRFRGILSARFASVFGSQTGLQQVAPWTHRALKHARVQVDGKLITVSFLIVWLHMFCLKCIASFWLSWSSAMASFPPHNFSWVEQGKVAGLALPRMTSEYQYLLDNGIKHLVCLCERKPPYYDTCPDLKLHHIKIVDFTPPSQSQIERFLSIVEEANSHGEVRTHCWSGLL